MRLTALLGTALVAQQLTLAPAPPPPRADWPGARLHLLNETLRVPFGEDWYGYFVRRLAERPANLLFLLKNVARR